MEPVKKKEKILRRIIEKSLRENFIVHDAEGTLSASVGEVVDEVTEALLHHPDFLFKFSVRRNKKEQ